MNVIEEVHWSTKTIKYPPIIPQHYEAGPTSAQSDINNFFTPSLISYLTKFTRARAESLNLWNIYGVNKDLFSEEIFWRWYLVSIGFCMVNYTEYLDAWKTKETYDGLLGNTWIRSVIPSTWFRLVNRAFSFEELELEKRVNEIISKHQKPAQIICLDETQTRWTGRGGSKKKNPKKPVSLGEECWKMADSTNYTFHLFYTSNRELKAGQKLGYSFLLEFLGQLPHRYEQYIFLMDPGPMGTRKCAETLQRYKQKFVICISLQNKFKKLFHVLTRNLAKYQWRTFYSDKMALIVWWAKNDATNKPKYVGFLTNINGVSSSFRSPALEKLTAASN